MVTEREIYDAAQDIPAIRAYLQSLDQATEVRVNDPCACVYHGYLFHRFPDVRRVNIYFDNLRVQPNAGSYDLRVDITSSFAEHVQQAWTDRVWGELQKRGVAVSPRNEWLTPAQCIEELDAIEKECRDGE